MLPKACWPFPVTNIMYNSLSFFTTFRVWKHINTILPSSDHPLRAPIITDFIANSPIMRPEFSTATSQLVIMFGIFLFIPDSPIWRIIKSSMLINNGKKGTWNAVVLHTATLLFCQSLIRYALWIYILLLLFSFLFLQPVQMLRFKFNFLRIVRKTTAERFPIHIFWIPVGLAIATKSNIMCCGPPTRLHWVHPASDIET